MPCLTPFKFARKPFVMLWVLIFLSVIAVILSYLLFAPFYLEINSITGVYGVRFHHLATARVMLKNSTPVLDLRIAGWKKEVDLATKFFKKKKKRPVIKKEKTGPGISIAQVLKLLKTFRINRFYLDLDTGNMPVNGLLYPAFYWAGRYLDKPVSINFYHRNEVVIEVENNFARILRIIISSTLKRENHGKLK